MLCRFFSKIAKETIIKSNKKNIAKNQINPRLNKNLEWMKKKIKEANSTPNSVVVLDSSKMESAVRKAREECAPGGFGQS